MQFLLKYFVNSYYKKEIEILSQNIEKRIYETLSPIDSKSAPKEIRPLINAINRLIAYFEDRSLQEQDFSANASHELRTPLAGIRIQTEIAVSTDNIELQRKSLQNILIAIDQNERLIDQLLAMARTTADRVELATEKVNIHQVSLQVIENLMTLAKEKNINFKLEVPKNLVLFASKESIFILLHNLILNAINYIQDNGRILIKSIELKDKVHLLVSDNGPGIPKDKYAVVLKRFQKFGYEAKSGSGLGLSIVKRICDLHHASLKLSKTEKSGGLKVSVIFSGKKN